MSDMCWELYNLGVSGILQERIQKLGTIGAIGDIAPCANYNNRFDYIIDIVIDIVKYKNLWMGTRII